MGIKMIKAEIAKLELNPGDKIIIKFQQKLPMDRHQAVRKAIEQFAPGHPIMILDGGVDLQILKEVK